MVTRTLFPKHDKDKTGASVGMVILDVAFGVLGLKNPDETIIPPVILVVVAS